MLDELQPSELSRLAILQDTLQAIPAGVDIAAFIGQSLHEVPGVVAVSVCINGILYPPGGALADLCRHFAAMRDKPAAIDPECLIGIPRTTILPISTLRRLYGFLAFVVTNPEIFAPYLGFLRNLANIVATTLKTRDDIAQITQANDTLDRTVHELEERAHALTERRGQLELNIADRERSLLESEKKYRTIFEESFDGLFVTSPEGEILDMNKKGVAMFGYDTKEEMQHLDLARDVYADLPDRQSILSMVNAQGSGEYETVVKKKGGGKMMARCSLTVARDENGAITSYRGIIRDITERKRVAAELERTTQALKTLGAGNAAMLHATDEQELLDAVCKVAVESGGYRLAWVGYAEDDPAKSVRPMAQAGFDEGYVKVVDATWADTPRGARPAGAAIRTGKTQIVDDIATDPRFEPLRAEPLARGYRSAIALPLHMNAYIRGALTIYAPLPDAFDGEAASLLTKLAEDLAFGIAALRMRKARDQAELDLKESAEKLRAITEAAQDAVILVDARGAIVYWNSAAVRIFGYSTEVAFGQDLHKFLPPPADQTDAAKGFARFAETGQGPILGRTLELTALRNGGGEFPVEVSVGAVKLGGQWCAVGIVRDITERKRAEAERQLHIETERQAIVNTVQAIALTIEKRDPYTAGHERRVADLGVAIAREMRLPESQVEGLYMAGLIHDVGKIEVPAEILSRPGALSPAQFALVKTHCQAGYDIIKDIPTPWPLAAVALQHHERLDGSGYPNGLKGDDICIEARIMAVADVVEAMMSHRPYRAALGIDAALTEITAGRGTRFDAAAVDACIALFREKGFAFPAAGTKPVFAGRYTSLR